MNILTEGQIMKRRILAGFAASFIAASLMTAPASAYTPYSDDLEATGATATITKYLIMDKGVAAPNVTMTYSLAADSTNVTGTASADNYNVYPGLMEGVKINDAAVTGTTVSFNNTSTTSSVTTAATGLTSSFNGETQAYVSGNFNISFAEVKFPEPGVYRYTLTETDNRDDVTPIDNETRTVDVFVVDDSKYVEGVYTKKLKIASVVVYSDQITSIKKSDIETASTSKSSAFNNQYVSHDIELSKTVTGNQGSKDKYFEFEVSITNAGNSTKIMVDLTGADASLDKTKTINSSITANTNPEFITTDASGAVTQKFYLTDGQKIKLQGLPDGAAYTITEKNASDYTAAMTANEAVGVTNTTAPNIATAYVVSDTAIKADTTIEYTNNKDGTIPTGVILSVAGPAVIGIIVVGALVFVNVKRKKESAED